jgi:hypothetical protein
MTRRILTLSPPRNLLRRPNQQRQPLLPVQHLHGTRRIPTPPALRNPLLTLPGNRPLIHAAMVHMGVPGGATLTAGCTRPIRAESNMVQPIRGLRDLSTTAAADRRGQRRVARRVLPRPQRQHALRHAAAADHGRGAPLGQLWDSRRRGRAGLHPCRPRVGVAPCPCLVGRVGSG